MDAVQFRAMVERLEVESVAAPAAYRMKVAALALLGFLILALLLGSVGLGLLLLGGLAAAVAFSGGSALILLFKLGKLLILLVVPFWYLLKFSVLALFVRLPKPEGLEVTRAQAPALFAAVDGMRRRMKGPRVHHVLVVDEVNAAIVQRPALGLVGWPRNHLLLGLPLLEGMPPEEALAVVAHEYGHLAGSHGRFGAYIYRLRNTWSTIQNCAEHLQGWLGRALLPLVRWFAPYFNAYTFVLARANEYQADAASVELVGADAAARALKRVNLVAPQYEAFMGLTFERIREDAAPPDDLGQRWAQQATLPPNPEDAQRWLAEALDRERQVSDTHPVLRARLQALPGLSEDLQVAPPPLQGDTAAQAWLGALLPDLRERLQAAWANRVAGPWTERHQDVQRKLQRLQALRGQAERDDAETFELLRLQTELEPAVDMREAWAGFNAAHPDHAAGLFFEGAERLFHGDETGLPLLESALAKDADYLKPAAERAHAFLAKRKDEAGAERWAERWRLRDAFETQRQIELKTADVQHTLHAPDLDEATLQQLRTMVAGATEHVAALYLARRELPSDPSAKTYLLGIELTWWGRRRGKAQAVVDRMVALAWPMHLFVCTLEGQYADFKGPLTKLPGTRLA